MRRENFVNLLNRLNIKFEERKVTKNNGVVLDGFVLKTGRAITPTVYFDQLDTKSEMEWTKFLLTLMEEAERGDDVALDDILSPNYIMHNAYLGVRNIEKNVNDTETICRVVDEFEDLEKFVYIRIDGSHALSLGMTEGYGSLKVNSALLERTGMSENTIFEIATANTMDDIQFKGMVETLTQMLPFDCDLELPINDSVEQIYICNYHNNAVYGSGCLGNFKELKKRIEKEIGFKRFYIIPSSIHEILIVRADNLSREELSSMVNSVNEEAVSDTEVLSNHAYGVFTI